MGRVEAENSQLLLQVQHLFLRYLDLLLEFVELAVEPLRNALRRLEARLITVLDVVRDDLVDDVLRQLWVQAGVTDAHEVGLGDLRYAEAKLKSSDDALTDDRIFHA